MKDLIRRQAAWDALNARCEIECDYSRKQRAFMCGSCKLGSAFEVIEELPTIEPKRGGWETEVRTIRGHKIAFFACSVCGRNADGEYPYCPNCGAKMEGSEDEAD